MDITPLVRLGDRILERFAPKATAAAARCYYEYRCVYRTSTCVNRDSRQRRRVCHDSGEIYHGAWVTVGCC